MKRLKCLAALMALLCAVTVSNAGERFGMGLKLGTQGIGLEFTAGVSHWLAFRVTANQYDYSDNLEKSGIEYDGTLKLGGYGVLADFYPAKSMFRLTLGGLSNRNELGMKAVPTTDVDIGGSTYTPAQVGTLSGDMQFQSVVPYFGIGYGNASRGPHRVGFVFDLGAVYQGSGDVTLSSSAGGVSQADLDSEAQQIEDDTKAYKFWPVIAFGISFRF